MGQTCQKGSTNSGIQRMLTTEMSAIIGRSPDPKMLAMDGVYTAKNELIFNARVYSDRI